jgi:hypothetical protein
MFMMNRFAIVFLAAVLLAAAACNRTNKAEQLAALDNAYQSGLLTKDEYEAKKVALTAEAPAPAPVATQPLAPAPVPIPSPAAAPPATPPIALSAPPVGAEATEPEPAPLAGCEDAEFKSGGHKGAEERFFAAPLEVVKRAAVSALGSLDFNIHKNSNNEIEASKKRNIGVIVGAGGERVILAFQKATRAGQSGTRVIGQTKKSFVGRVTQKTWTDAVLAQIACKLRESSR